MSEFVEALKKIAEGGNPAGTSKRRSLTKDQMIQVARSVLRRHDIKWTDYQRKAAALTRRGRPND